jgi:hypothetical protein
MSLVRSVVLVTAIGASLIGCGDEETVIPKGDFTEAEKKAIQAEDAKVAEQESHGTKKK